MESEREKWHLLSRDDEHNKVMLRNIFDEKDKVEKEKLFYERKYNSLMDDYRVCGIYLKNHIEM